MKTASEPYSTALLITRSKSYSRYFSTATAMAANRHKTARPLNTVTGPELKGNPAANETISSTAAAANHFSCSRSSPEDRANLTTTAAAPTASAATTQTAGANATAGPHLTDGGGERAGPQPGRGHQRTHHGQRQRPAHKPCGRAPPARAQAPGREQ